MFRVIKVNPKFSEFGRVFWKKGYHQDITNLQIPCQVWYHLFPHNLQEHMVRESITYSEIDQINLSVTDLRIGILFFFKKFLE